MPAPDVSIRGSLVWSAPAEPGGFAWDEAPGREPRLVRRHGPLRSYNLFREEPGLFLTFASLEGPDDYLSFSDAYGPLAPRGLPVGYQCQDETLSRWAGCHSWMAWMVSVWSALAGGEPGMRDDLEQPAVPEIREPDWAGWAAAGIGRTEPPGFAWAGPDGLPFSGVSDYYFHQLNAECQRCARLNLEPTGHPAWGGLGGASRELVLRPESLWGGLVCELFIATVLHLRFRECVVCGRWFDIGHNLLRAGKETCSGACKKRLTRQRKKESPGAA